MDKKLRTFLRKEMMKINNYPTKFKSKSQRSFVFAFAQAKFDLLMDIDRKFKLGAFYKRRVKC